MRNRVLVVSYYFPPFNGAVTQHAQWLARYLPEFGLDPHVLSSSVFYAENTGAPLVTGSVHAVPESGFGKRAALAIGRLEMYLQVKARLWDLGFGWAEGFGWRKGKELLGTGEFTGIVSVSPSISSHWLAYRLKRRFPELTWVADFTDPLVGNPFRDTAGWLRGTEARLEKAFFATADHLAANTEPVRQFWTERHPHYRDKFFVMSNGFDPDEHVGPLPIPARTVPTLAHVGAVYGGRVPNALFDALFELVESGRMPADAVKVEFLGGTNFDHVHRPERLRFLRDRGVVQVRSRHVPRREALEFAARADSLLILDITEPHNTRLQLPSKVFDCVRIGRPILAFTAADSPTESVLSSSGIPHAIIHNQAPIAEVKEGLLQFLAMDRRSGRPSPWILENFDAREIVKCAAERLLPPGTLAGAATGEEFAARPRKRQAG